MRRGEPRPESVLIKRSQNDWRLRTVKLTIRYARYLASTFGVIAFGIRLSN